MLTIDKLFPLGNAYPLARTQERASYSMDHASFWKEWWLLTGGRQLIEAATMIAPGLREHCDRWISDRGALLMDRRVDRIVGESGPTPRPWAGLWGGPTPWAVIVELGDGSFEHAISLHPLHACLVARLHRRTRLAEEEHELAQLLRQLAATTDERLRYDYREGPGMVAALKRYRLYAAYRRGEASEEQLAPVKTYLREQFSAACQERDRQKDVVAARLREIAKELVRLRSPQGLPALGRPSAVVSPTDTLPAVTTPLEAHDRGAAA